MKKSMFKAKIQSAKDGNRGGKIAQVSNGHDKQQRLIARGINLAGLRLTARG